MESNINAGIDGNNDVNFQYGLAKFKGYSLEIPVFDVNSRNLKLNNWKFQHLFWPGEKSLEYDENLVEIPSQIFYCRNTVKFFRKFRCEFFAAGMANGKRWKVLHKFRPWKSMLENDGNFEGIFHQRKGCRNLMEIP